MVLVLFAVAGVWPSGFQTLRSKSYYHAGSAFARALGGARGVQGAGPSSILTSVTPRAGTIAPVRGVFLSKPRCLQGARKAPLQGARKAPLQGARKAPLQGSSPAKAPLPSAFRSSSGF